MAQKHHPISTRRSEGPGSIWLTRFLLYPALLVIAILGLRLWNSESYYGLPKNRTALVDSLIVNLAATSSLFLLSALVLQNALKHAAREDFHSIVSEVLKQELAPYSVLLAPWTGNITEETCLNVTRNFKTVSERFVAQLRESKENDRVYILNTWIPQLADSIDKEDFIDGLTKAWRQGASIRILMVFPGCYASTLRSESVSEDGAYHNEMFVALLVEDCLRTLNAIANSLARSDGHYRQRLEVRLYSTLPSVSIYSTSNIAFIGTFLHGKRAIEGPQFTITTGARFVEEAYNKEFDVIWNSTTTRPYPLCTQGGSDDVHYQLDCLRGTDPFK